MSRKRPSSDTPASNSAGYTFAKLVESIRAIHAEAASQANRAVNISLTLRNWLIGCHIAEYELRGQDRAAYGEKLLDSLADELTSQKVSNSNRRQLYRYLRFYRTYPQIVGTLSPQFRAMLPEANAADPKKVGTPSPQSALPAETLLNRLSYSHLELIVDQDDEPKRDFYAAEAIRGNWSVRELKRQIASLYLTLLAEHHRYDHGRETVVRTAAGLLPRSHAPRGNALRDAPRPPGEAQGRDAERRKTAFPRGDR